MKSKDYIYIFIIVILVLAIVSVYYLNLNKINSIEEKNTLYKNLLSLGTEDTTKLDEGNSYYKDASISYEKGDYSDVVTSCEKARDSWSEYNQGLREEKERVLEYEGDIFETYSDLISSEVKIYNYMYEACEWFETASRQYAYYSLSTTPEDDISLVSGNDAIESMNEKIRAHDAEVEVYNTLLAKYKSQLNKILADK